MFQVKQVQQSRNQESESPTATSPSDTSTEEEREEAKDGACRICYCDDFDKADPLIAPCHCDGSVKLVHLKCLQMWLSERLTTRINENSVAYY